MATVSRFHSYSETSVTSHRIHAQLKVDVVLEPETSVQVRGELDLGSVGILEEALAEIETLGKQRVVIDLSGLTFIDLAGLSRFVDARSRLAHHGCVLEVTAISLAVGRLLDILETVGCPVELSQGQEPISFR